MDNDNGTIKVLAVENFQGAIMEIADLLSLESVIPNLKVTSKKQSLQELARHGSQLFDLDERELFDTLLEREKLGTTGVGNGIAIPHGKLPNLDRLHGIFARMEKPVDFEAIDERPVDLIFLLLAPESAGADHLKALAKVSRLLRDQTVVEKLRGSEQPEALFSLLTDVTTSRAA